MRKNDYAVFEAAGFRGNTIKFEDEPSSNKRVLGWLIAISVLMIAFIALFCYLKGKESYTYSYESIQRKNTTSIAISASSGVFYAPIETQDTYLGYLPERIELLDVHIYDVRYMPNAKNMGDFIGISVSLLSKYSSNDLRLDADKDGIVWIFTHRVTEIENIP